METIEQLVGTRIVSLEAGHNDFWIMTLQGTMHMYHRQSCCERVYLEAALGDLESLKGATITGAYETYDKENVSYGSAAWTFYHINTDKGDLCISFYGSSNGYYNIGVDLDWTPGRDESDEWEWN